MANVVNNMAYPDGIDYQFNYDNAAVAYQRVPMNGAGEKLYDEQSSSGGGKQSLWQSKVGIEKTGAYENGKYEDFNNFDIQNWMDIAKKK
jgi:beta-xylosidase